MTSVTRIAVAYFVGKYQKPASQTEIIATNFRECWHSIFLALETASDTKSLNKDSLTFTVAEELIMPYLKAFPQVKPQIPALREAWRRGARLCRERLEPTGNDGQIIESIDAPQLQQSLLDTVGEIVGTRHPLVALLAYRNNFCQLLVDLVGQKTGIFPGKQQSPDTTAVAPRSETSSPLLQIGPDSAVDHYIIIGKIGAGGMGVVYKANDDKLKRQVAIKFIMSGGQGMLRRRFEREMEVSAHLNHPNIIKVYGVGIYRQLPYMVMEYIEGRPLLEYIFTQKIDRNAQLVILEKVARALNYAHKQNIIHRDVKPSNIMVRHNGEPILMDFGIAKVTEVSDRSLTRSGEVIGTLQYMSPEQAQGLKKEISPATDVYSLGAVLYQLLTGKSLVEGTTIEKIHQIIHKKPRRPRRLRPDIPAPLERICLHALEKNIKNRYPNCKHFAADLHAFIKGKQTESDQFYRRKKLQTIGIGIGILALAVFLAWATRIVWSQQRYQQRITTVERQLLRIERNFDKTPEAAARQLALIAREIDYLRDHESRSVLSPKIAELQLRLKQTQQIVGRCLAVVHSQRAYQKAQQHIAQRQWGDAAIELEQGQLILAEAKNHHGSAALLDKIETALQRVAFFQENYRIAYYLGKKQQQNLDADGRWSLAYSAYRCRLYHQAQEYFQQIIQQGPASQRSKALYYYGRIALAMRRYHQAQRLFFQSMQNHKLLPPQLANDLRLYYCCAALADIDRPISSDELTRLCKLLAQFKPVDSSRNLYRRTQARLWLKLAEKADKSKLDRQQLQQAVAIFSQDHSAQMLYLRGKAQVLLQNTAAARQDFALAFASNPSSIAPLLAKVQLLRTEITPWEMSLSELEYNRLVMQGLDVDIDLFAQNFNELRQQYLQRNLGKSGCQFNEKQFQFYYHKLNSSTAQVARVARTAIASMTPSTRVIARLRQERDAGDREIAAELIAMVEKQRQQHEHWRLIVNLLEVPSHGKIIEIKAWTSPDNQKELEKVMTDANESLLLRFLAARILIRIGLPEVRRQLYRRYLETNAGGQNEDWWTRILIARALQEIDYHYHLLDAQFPLKLAEWTMQARSSLEQLPSTERDFFLANIAMMLDPKATAALEVLRWIMANGGDQARVVSASRFVSISNCPCPEIIIANLYRCLQSQTVHVRAYALQVLAQFFSDNARLWTNMICRYCRQLPLLIYRMVTPPAMPGIELQRAALNFWRYTIRYWRYRRVLTNEQYQNIVAAIRRLWQHADPLLRCQSIITSAQIFDRLVFDKIAANTDRVLVERMAAMVGMLICQDKTKLGLWLTNRMPQLANDPNWQARGFLIYTFCRFMDGHLGHFDKTPFARIMKNYLQGQVFKSLDDPESFVQVAAALSCYFLDCFGLFTNKHQQRLQQIMRDDRRTGDMQATALALLLNMAYSRQSASLAQLHARAMKLPGRQRYIAAYGYIQPIENTLAISATTVRILQSNKARLCRYRIHWSLLVNKKLIGDWCRRIVKMRELLTHCDDSEVYHEYSYILALLYLRKKDYQQAGAVIQQLLAKNAGCPAMHYADLWLKLLIARQNLAGLTSYFRQLRRQLSKAAASGNVATMQQLQVLMERSRFVVYCADPHYHQPQQRALYSEYVGVSIPLPSASQDFDDRLHKLLLQLMGTSADKVPAAIAKGVQAQYLYAPQSPAGLLLLGKLRFLQKRYLQAQTIFAYVDKLMRRDYEAKYWHKLAKAFLNK